MLLKSLKIPEHRNLKLDRKFSVAPMMECSVCRRICSFFNFLGGTPSVGVVSFVVPIL